MRPMDHMDYEEVEYIKTDIIGNPISTYDDSIPTYVELLNDIIFYLESDGEISATEGLNECQQARLCGYLQGFHGNCIKVKNVGFQIPNYTFRTDSEGIEETFDILSEAVCQKVCKARKTKYKKVNYPKNKKGKNKKGKTVFNDGTSTDIDDYLDGLAKISKPYVPKPIKIEISPVPENIDEAIEFLKGLS